jgi:hypothetical protein
MFPDVGLPRNIDLIHAGHPGTLAAPIEENFNGFSGTFHHGLDISIREIADPADGPALPGGLLGFKPETDALDPAMDDNMRPCIRFHGTLLTGQLTRLQ